MFLLLALHARGLRSVVAARVGGHDENSSRMTLKEQVFNSIVGMGIDLLSSAMCG